MKRILVVEDETKLAELLADYLRKDNFEVHLIADGVQVMDAFRSLQPAAILLDLMLPGQDGLSLCKALRAVSNVPILITTARVEEIDRLLGLELGADDYICKPYSPREVVARIKAVLRRVQAVATGTSSCELVFDDAQMKARFFGTTLDLTAVEFKLLRTLATEPGHILSRAQLMDHIYTDHRIVSDRTIDSHIKKLRKKLDEIKPSNYCIKSVYGVGYRYEPDTG